ncbi:MAG: SurA N-terminal domain-containing protein [Candidatus Omnitrophica bacterium]|nr:SurA N-terminal domain-containing protein [Candidatus Omnitrophota bacterium]
MLNYLRKKIVAKRILWILAIIIIPAFVLWGTESLSKRDSSLKYVGVIEGEKIPLDKFVKSINDVRIGLFLNYFNQPEVLDKINGDRKLLNRLAWENLMIQTKAKKEKTSIPDSAVVGFITRHPFFLRGGIFDEKLYNYILKNSLRIQPRGFEESVRNFLLTAKYKADIVKDVVVTDEELFNAYKNEFEKAKIYYVIVDKDILKKYTDVPADEISMFYRQNSKMFMEPERAILQYIAFPHKESGEKEKVLAEMRNVYEKLKKRPSKWDNIAKSLNLKVGETSPFSKDDVGIPDIATTYDLSVLTAKLRPMAEVLPLISERDKGVSYIIRVKRRLPPRMKTEEEAAYYITEILKDRKAESLASEKAENIYKKAVSAETSINEVSEKNNLKLRQTDFVSRFDYIEEIGEAYPIVEEASKLKPGEISPPIKVRKGFALIEPVAFQRVDKNEFEKEKETYRNKVLSAKKMKALQDWLNKINANSSLNVDLDKI